MSEETLLRNISSVEISFQTPTSGRECFWINYRLPHHCCKIRWTNMFLTMFYGCFIIAIGSCLGDRDISVHSVKVFIAFNNFHHGILNYFDRSICCKEVIQFELFWSRHFVNHNSNQYRFLMLFVFSRNVLNHSKVEWIFKIICPLINEVVTTCRTKIFLSDNICIVYGLYDSFRSWFRLGEIALKSTTGTPYKWIETVQKSKISRSTK